MKLPDRQDSKKVEDNRDHSSKCQWTIMVSIYLINSLSLFLFTCFFFNFRKKQGTYPLQLIIFTVDLTIAYSEKRTQRLNKFKRTITEHKHLRFCWKQGITLVKSQELTTILNLNLVHVRMRMCCPLQKKKREFNLPLMVEEISKVEKEIPLADGGS